MGIWNGHCISLKYVHGNTAVSDNSFIEIMFSQSTWIRIFICLYLFINLFKVDNDKKVKMLYTKIRLKLPGAN